jgi:dipeptidyl aminopeptidase/acylaminoacyl peptidase
MNRRWAFLAVVVFAEVAGAQVVTRPDSAQRGAGRGRGRPQREMWRTAADTLRAKQLYVSKDSTDLPKIDSARAADGIRARLATEAFFTEKSKGVMDFQVVSYKSSADGLEIPAYVFSPPQKRGARGHAAMVWVHGYVHGRFEDRQLVWVREAVQRGYVIVTPQYRGSTGYEADFYNAIDYGGKEVDDVMSAVDYIKANLPYVDPERLGIMGWSHGGFITSHILFRDNQPFKAGAPIVPVTNLFFRLSLKGPGYQSGFSTQPGIQGLPFEKREEYIKRSPVFHAGNLKVPILVHAATNDCDVDFIENQQMVYTLMALHPTLTDAKIYKDPPYILSNGADGRDGRTDGQGALGGCGHTFSERVVTDRNSPRYLERADSPEQIDAWNRIWAFFEKHLNPNKGR